jgi:hypothetical protein
MRCCDGKRRWERTVVDVRPVAPGELHLTAKVLAAEARKALATELEAGLDELDVWPLAEGVVDDSLVLVDGD